MPACGHRAWTSSTRQNPKRHNKRYSVHKYTEVLDADSIKVLPGPPHLLSPEQLSGKQAVKGAVAGPKSTGEHKHVHVQGATGGACNDVLPVSSHDIARHFNVLQVEVPGGADSALSLDGVERETQTTPRRDISLAPTFSMPSS